jgi:hypothetical protein
VTRRLVQIVGVLVVFVVAVNLVWYVAVPVLGDPGVYRPLFLTRLYT